jgi:hypothetical protein
MEPNIHVVLQICRKYEQGSLIRRLFNDAVSRQHPSFNDRKGVGRG